ncbi:MAG TPA: ElyC/SanA/YdcF family protein [Candidatus Solibacter sp.]|nr:ElyC/SanA/YdcF family protein [Candidatus Solibacter sp.]
MNTDKKKALLAAALGAVASLPLAGWMIDRTANGRVYSSVASIPHRRVGLVLGCAETLGRGYVNPFFTTRIQAAADLFRAGKVDYLIVSGDNHRKGYDEPTAMKCALIRSGVPADRVVCDYAGFRTLDSVVRAKAVFGQDQVTVISQDFHTRRAIFLAQHRGVDAIGFAAADVDAYSGFTTRFREQLSRVRAVLDIYVWRRSPKFLGPRVEVGKL